MPDGGRVLLQRLFKTMTISSPWLADILEDPGVSTRHMRL
jgi:hypothetical protein